jgi:hypothetical protein
VSSRNHRYVSLLAVLSVFCLLALGASAQDSTAQVQKAKGRAVESFYVHGALGMGVDVYSSKDIEDMVVADFNIGSVGFPFQYGIRGGFRNIAQIEYCKYSTSGHSIGMGGFVDGEAVSLVNVEMELKATDILFKINPFFWSWAKPTNGIPAKCLFLIVGNGDATYLDKVEDGFEGSGTIYGLEWAGISKYVSFSVGATYQNIKFGSTTLSDIDFHEANAKRFLMYMRLGLGFGM